MASWRKSVNHMIADMTAKARRQETSAASIVAGGAVRVEEEEGCGVVEERGGVGGAGLGGKR